MSSTRNDSLPTSAPTIHVHESPEDEDEVKTLSANLNASLSNSNLKVSFGFRSPSPISDQRLHLTLPSLTSGRGTTPSSDRRLLVPDGGCDEKHLIKSLKIIGDVLGFKKSFSTGDILDIEAEHQLLRRRNSRRCRSEIHPTDASPPSPSVKLEATSRTLSTWVAIGDTAATTQLPSPQATRQASPNFTAADLVRSVNKRLRQTYLRKRLFTTCSALKRLSRSGFNLEKLHDFVDDESGRVSAADLGPMVKSPRKNALSSREIERDRGKSLSKYERNVLIFDWLHNLNDDSSPTSS